MRHRSELPSALSSLLRGDREMSTARQHQPRQHPP
jgi:hypothetical protein